MGFAWNLILFSFMREREGYKHHADCTVSLNQTSNCLPVELSCWPHSSPGLSSVWYSWPVALSQTVTSSLWPADFPHTPGVCWEVTGGLCLKRTLTVQHGVINNLLKYFWFAYIKQYNTLLNTNDLVPIVVVEKV